jgi:hypothetical protein
MKIEIIKETHLAFEKPFFIVTVDGSPVRQYSCFEEAEKVALEIAKEGQLTTKETVFTLDV